MNSCILMAEIVQEPQLRYTPDTQMAIAEMLVQFPGLRAEDPPATLKVIGWGNLAQEIQERYHPGDRVVIEGRLSMNTIDRPEGFKEKRAELTAQRIHSWGSGSQPATFTAPPRETTTPMAAPARSSAPKPANPLPNAGVPTAPPVRSPEPTAFPAPQPLPTYPPSDAEPDYDDIPFMQPVASQGGFGDDLIDSDLHRPRVGFEFRKF